jgi:hypothetical protein
VFDDNIMQYKKELEVVAFVDPAISQKSTADYTAISVV